MEIKVSYIVKVVKCVDEGVPIEKKYMGKRGIVKEINDDRPSPICVFFEGIGEDGFWPEELEVIKIYDFSKDNMTDDWKEQFKAFDFYFAHEMGKSKALPKGLQVGKIFSIGVADGFAYYEVSKIFKTRVHLIWRKDLCPDNYSDHHFRDGGSFDRWEVEEYINRTDALAKIFS